MCFASEGRVAVYTCDGQNLGGETRKWADWSVINVTKANGHTIHYEEPELHRFVLEAQKIRAPLFAIVVINTGVVLDEDDSEGEDHPLPLTNPCVMVFIYRQSVALTSLRETRCFVVANSNMKDFLCTTTKDAETSQQVQDAYFVRPSLPVHFSGGPKMSEFLRGQLYQTVQLYIKKEMDRCKLQVYLDQLILSWAK